LLYGCRKMKKLLLVRHAKSDQSLMLSDQDRPLNARGKKDAPLLGKALANYAWIPDIILSSPALRALTTAQAIREQLSTAHPLHVDKRLYSGGFQGYMDCISETSDAFQNLALFGHNPVITEVAQFLLKLPTAPILPTGTMILLQSNAQSWGSFEKNQVSLVFYLIPRLL